MFTILAIGLVVLIVFLGISVDHLERRIQALEREWAFQSDLNKHWVHPNEHEEEE